MIYLYGRTSTKWLLVPDYQGHAIYSGTHEGIHAPRPKKRRRIVRKHKSLTMHRSGQ